MSYFSDHYNDLVYPTIDTGPGLYNAQVGAIHEIASHFTLHERPAIITMPTGSGKTAVLMMSPYVLKAKRVLVVTPSRLVRDQIADDFCQLATLTDMGALPAAITKPHVKEQSSRITSPDDWAALAEFDVVVGTTNCTSPGYMDIPTPPVDLFDLILIDEAHHSPAATWHDLLAAFPASRKILFTATPFRRDRREIEGRFAYSYPLARAYDDRIFGQITYIPAGDNDVNQDVAVAKKTEETLIEDRKAGLNHFVMVRTDRRSRARELLELYRAHTSLRLELIHSQLSQQSVSRTLAKLREGKLDGVVCVNMMGEGFNFPHLKIAAIHAPHKSLEVTLQFIGRFARTNAPDIGSAKFIAARSEVEIEGKRFFDDTSVWHEIIIGLSEGRVAEEIHLRDSLERFDQPTADEDLADLSLYSLHPRSHVKIYDAPEGLELPEHIPLSGNIELAYENINDARNTIVMITRTRYAPKWSASDRIVDVSYDLFVIYHDRDTSLLFINASRSREGMYRTLVAAISPELSPLSTSLTQRVIKDLKNQKIFNLGMRNILATNQSESYKILTGPSTGASVKPSDSINYRQGHAFLSGEENGEKTTIGYSSLSKVWATAQLQLPHLVEWCAALGTKVRSTGQIVTNSGLDYLSTGDVIESLPAELIAVQWNDHAFDYSRPVEARYVDDAGTSRRVHISDCELVIDRSKSTADTIAIQVCGEGLVYPVEFTLDDFYTSPTDEDRIKISWGTQTVTLLEYLNEFMLDFFTAAGGLLRGNEYFAPKTDPTPLDLKQVVVWDWRDTDITQELMDTTKGKSVHTRVREYLESRDDLIALIDHGTGEVADFVTLRKEGTALLVHLYHCKGSSEPVPGARLPDVVGVCSQAQKCTPWRNLDSLRRKLTTRSVTFLRGSKPEMIALFEEAKSLRLEMRVSVVQPGISKNTLSKNLVLCLGATNDSLMNAACQPLVVIASE